MMHSDEQRQRQADDGPDVETIVEALCDACRVVNTVPR